MTFANQKKEQIHCLQNCVWQRQHRR